MMSSSVAVSGRDIAQIRAENFLSKIFAAPRDYSIRIGETELPSATTPRFQMNFKDPAALRRLFSPPLELKLGEGFIRGDLDITGDIYSAFDVIDALPSHLASISDLSSLASGYLALPSGKAGLISGRGPLELQGEKHSKERDLKAVQYHYDVGNDFYSIWLDKNMLYSCAYFPPGVNDLDTAQIRKMEHICRKLRLQAGETLLDIGCGWGGLIRYAASHYGVKALGVTLSKRQAEYANQKIAEMRLGEQVKVELQDYRDLTSGSFDKIVSVGMFEHVGRSHLPEYFTHVYRLLKPGGLFLNHGISLRQQAPKMIETDDGGHPRLAAVKKSPLSTWLEKKLVGVGSFSQKYIFPDGELELVSDANLFAEMAGFEVRDVENLREHYALTIRNWLKNLADHQAEVEKASDPVTYRTWRLYLASSVHGFETGSISVNQSLLSKTVGGKANLPLTREDLYQPVNL